MAFTESITDRMLANNDPAPGGEWPQGYTINPGAFAISLQEYFAGRITATQFAGSWQCDLTPATPSRVQLDSLVAYYTASPDKLRFVLHLTSIFTNMELDQHNIRSGGTTMGYRTASAINNYIDSIDP